MDEEILERDEAAAPESGASDTGETGETAGKPRMADGPRGSDVHSVAARAPARNRLAADVEAFLARGGRIVEVPGAP